MPDVPLVVEGWCDTKENGIVAKMTQYDPDGEAILVSGREPIHYPEESFPWVWVNMRSEMDRLNGMPVLGNPVE